MAQAGIAKQRRDISGGDGLVGSGTAATAQTRSGEKNFFGKDFVAVEG